MNRTALVCTSLLCLTVIATALLLAGPLDPPAGPVTPTYKTLTEVEPRIAINAANTPGDADSLFRITQPGSYYLTGNVLGVSGKRGIEIATDYVRLDLMGFDVLGVSGSLEGIVVENNISTSIRNGHVASWGSDGIRVNGNSMAIEDLTVDFCGGWGVFLNTLYPNNRVSRVIVGQNTLGGISAGQVGLVEDCSVYYSPNAPGIAAFSATRIERCAIWNCNPGVLLAGYGAAVRGTSTYICPVGISATGSNGLIEKNIVQLNSAGVGLRATTASNTFADNTVNTVVGTGDKYDFVPGNHLRLTISQLPESIDWPAEVRLAGTLTGTAGQNGLTIAADDVSVDLGGHALLGVPGSLDGIAVSGSRRNISVRNGSLQSWGGDGIDLSAATSALVESVRASDNSGAGIRAGERAVVRGCVTRSNASDNIAVSAYSQVIDCLADASTGGHGINASSIQGLVRGCTASGNAMSGIRASQRTHVQGCVCSNNTLHGVHITFVGVVEDCLMNANGGDGVLMDAGGAVTIRNNSISESSGAGDAGIRISIGGACHIEGNQVTFCNTGILVATSGNVVVRNTGIASATNFSIMAGNTAGPVIGAGGAATATNPLANFTN